MYNDKYWYVTLGQRGQSIVIDLIPFFWAMDNGDCYEVIRSKYSDLLGYDLINISLRMKGEL